MPMDNPNDEQQKLLKVHKKIQKQGKLQKQEVVFFRLFTVDLWSALLTKALQWCRISSRCFHWNPLA